MGKAIPSIFSDQMSFVTPTTLFYSANALSIISVLSILAGSFSSNVGSSLIISNTDVSTLGGGATGFGGGGSLKTSETTFVIPWMVLLESNAFYTTAYCSFFGSATA